MAKKFTGNGSTPATPHLRDSIGYTLDLEIIHKFGRNPDIDENNTPEDIWEYGGQYNYPTIDAINYISSDDVTDTQLITVEGLDAIGINKKSQ